MVAEPSREFIVIVLGRTIDEWRGREESRHATGRAGFNAFGTPEDLEAKKAAVSGAALPRLPIDQMCKHRHAHTSQ